MAPKYKPDWVSVDDYAIHALGGEDACVSRKKIQEYIADNYGFNFEEKSIKERFKTALEKRKTSGLVRQDKQSFSFTREGVRHYHEEYETSEDDGEDSSPVSVKSKKSVEAAGTKKKKRASK